VEQFKMVREIIMDRLWQALIHRFGYPTLAMEVVKGGPAWGLPFSSGGLNRNRQRTGNNFTPLAPPKQKNELLLDCLTYFVYLETSLTDS
jgi:hypothetical protein